jgi:hypothetical protein
VLHSTPKHAAEEQAASSTGSSRAWGWSFMVGVVPSGWPRQEAQCQCEYISSVRHQLQGPAAGSCCQVCREQTWLWDAWPTSRPYRGCKLTAETLVGSVCGVCGTCMQCMLSLVVPVVSTSEPHSITYTVGFAICTGTAACRRRSALHSHTSCCTAHVRCLTTQQLAAALGFGVHDGRLRCS